MPAVRGVGHGGYCLSDKQRRTWCFRTEPAWHLKPQASAVLPVDFLATSCAPGRFFRPVEHFSFVSALESEDHSRADAEIVLDVGACVGKLRAKPVSLNSTYGETFRKTKVDTSTSLQREAVVVG